MRKLNYEERSAYAFVFPALIMLFLFMGLPVIVAFFLSFTDYSILEPPKFIGIQNYIFILKDRIFIRALLNTLYYTLYYVPLKLLLAFFVALALTRSTIISKFKGIFMTFFYIPVITSMAASSMIWLWIYQPDFGILNGILSFLGLPTSKWIYDSKTVIPSISLVTIWKDFGFNVVIFVSGLTTIGGEIYDAAKLDGAKGITLVKDIILPLLKPTILFSLVTSVILSFQVFTAIYIMTQGGPSNASTTVVHQIYLNAFAYLRMGRASAMAIVLFGIILTLSLIQFKLMKSEVAE